jgi:hypothetical protein
LICEAPARGGAEEIKSMQNWLAASAAALLMSAATMAPAEAATSFDGTWRVSVSTDSAHPRCQERTVSLRVEDGRVRYDGLLAGIASGTVAASGEITARIAKVSVAGRLAEDSGSGEWRSKNCVGTWSARRAA